MYRCEFCHRLALINRTATPPAQRWADIEALFDLGDRVTRLRRAYGRRNGRYPG